MFFLLTLRIRYLLVPFYLRRWVLSRSHRSILRQMDRWMGKYKDVDIDVCLLLFCKLLGNQGKILTSNLQPMKQEVRDKKIDGPCLNITRHITICLCIQSKEIKDKNMMKNMMNIKYVCIAYCGNVSNQFEQTD